MDRPATMSSGVRPARHEDLESLVALLATLFDQEDEFTASSSTQRDGLLRLLATPERARILVAEGNHQVVGMATLQVLVSTALGGPVALLEDVVVQPAARGTGVGAALVQAAINEATNMGCRRITLITDADNDAAQRLYQRHGFTHSPMIPMRHMLDSARISLDRVEADRHGG